MIDLTSFPIPQGNLPLQLILGKIGKNDLHSASRNSETGRNMTVLNIFKSEIFNDNIVATSCATMIKIGPVAQEIVRVTTASF